MSKALIFKAKYNLSELNAQLRYAKQYELPHWKNCVKVNNSDYANFNLKGTLEGIATLERDIAEIETLLAELLTTRAKHRENLEADIDKAQDELHDLELESEDVGEQLNEGELLDLQNLIYHLKEFMQECEEALGDLDD